MLLLTPAKNAVEELQGYFDNLQVRSRPGQRHFTCFAAGIHFGAVVSLARNFCTHASRGNTSVTGCSSRRHSHCFVATDT